MQGWEEPAAIFFKLPHSLWRLSRAQWPEAGTGPPLLLPLLCGEPARAGTALAGRDLGCPAAETVEEMSRWDSERKECKTPPGPRVGPPTPAQVTSHTPVIRTSF